VYPLPKPWRQKVVLLPGISKSCVENHLTWSLTTIRFRSSTRGLDSSTALEFVHALRVATDACRLSSVLALYQAGENLYRHFDKVCVLYEGRMAYFGPANQARQYFIDMGYVLRTPCLYEISRTPASATSLPTDKRRPTFWSL
jgi:hypothetical protein